MWWCAAKTFRADIWPEKHDFPGAEYLEIGWGEEGFYRAKRITAGITLRAVFLPTPAVLHVVGFDAPPEQFFPESEVVPVRLSDAGFRDLCRFIHDSYQRDGENRAISLGPGIYGWSKFYRSNSKYYFPKTCNVWTARAMRTAGTSFRPAGAITADAVLKQARRLQRDGATPTARNHQKWQ